jgi:protoporphyrinogen oxidase
VQRGISPLAIERFFAPFYGGILLDRSLSASAAVLLFTFKMLAEGRVGVPARGMGALPARIASQLPPGRVRVSAGVSSIMTADGRVSGVRLEDGAVVEAGHIVLATESPTTTRIAATAGVTVSRPEGQLGVTTIYFSSDTNLLPGRALWLNAQATATVSHAVTISDVAPEYAPGRTHLIAASIVGPAAEIEDEALIELARADVLMMARKDADQVNLSVQEVVRVPYAQYPQPPRPGASVRTARTDLPGLWLSGEALHSSSLEGAARGGLMAATAVLAR